jgi:hypothetical protein
MNNVYQINGLANIIQLITKLGQIIKEMLKLKLFINYCVVMLSVLR